MQSSFQRNVDNSISKTINLPNEATLEDVKQSYIGAWKMKCKSCTVYRDGSRTIQILNVGKNESEIVKTTEDPTQTRTEVVEREEVTLEVARSVDMTLQERERPEVLSGKTYRVRTGYGKLFITINSDESGRPFEVFATLGKSGGYFQEQTEAICRLISLALRSNINARYIVDHLKGIRGPMVTMTAKGTILSLPDAIAKILEEHINGGEGLDFDGEVVMATVEDELKIVNEVKPRISNFIKPICSASSLSQLTTISPLLIQRLHLSPFLKSSEDITRAGLMWSPIRSFCRKPMLSIRS